MATGTMATDQQDFTPVTFLALELTGRCQLRCAHCFAESGPAGTDGSMTTRDWERVIDDAAGMGVRAVQFIGGEPTLHPDLCVLVGHAVAAGLRVEVFSNLVHVTPRQWAALSLPGVSLATSWYTDDSAVHAQITGRAGTHARTRRTSPRRSGGASGCGPGSWTWQAAGTPRQRGSSWPGWA
jgi:MoaA/NifB/PqqE/SkfB family radical SAM enzyme